MRLIDADKLRQKDMSGGLIDIFDVLEAPTVEAIPIKWLRTWFTKKASLIGITLMGEIESDWEEENGL